MLSPSPSRHPRATRRSNVHSTGFSLRNFAPLGSYFRDELFFPGTRARDVEGDSVLCLQFYGAWAWAPMWQCSSASAASPTPKNSRPSSFSFLRFFPPLGPPSSWPWADAGMALVLIAPPHVCSWTDSSGEGFHPDTVLSPNPKSDPPSFFRPKVSQRRNPGGWGEVDREREVLRGRRPRPSRCRLVRSEHRPQRGEGPSEASCVVSPSVWVFLRVRLTDPNTSCRHAIERTHATLTVPAVPRHRARRWPGAPHEPRPHPPRRTRRARSLFFPCPSRLLEFGVK